MSCLYTFLAYFCFHIVASSSSDGEESTSDVPQSEMWPNCKAVRYTEQCQGTYVQFYLHTRRGSEIVNVTDNSNNITKTEYDDLRPNIIIVHGYNSDMTLDALVAIRKEIIKRGVTESLFPLIHEKIPVKETGFGDQTIFITNNNSYLKLGDYNIWTPDFPRLVKAPCYPFAVYNVPHIARCISNLVKGLRAIADEPYIHIVGFSLGAHVAGRAGYEVRDRQVDRVTGLDPALPLFFGVTPGERLSKSNAKFVDVVHTNMFMQGHYSALGHADFYMNGGSFQPGCVGGASERSGCDHHRAPQYFAESINSKQGFWGVQCSGLWRIILNRCLDEKPYIEMGDGVSLSARGQYYVKTAAESPFAIGYPHQSNTYKMIRRVNRTVV